MYQSFEEDRKLMDRSLEISSQEMMESNKKLSQQSQELQNVLDHIKDSIKQLDKNTQHPQKDMSLEELSSYLRDLIIEHQRNKHEIIQQKNYLFTIVDSIGE